MPPFAGPRVMLCTTRKPLKTLTDPSSIRTGTETATVFLHSERMLIRFGSTAKISPTRRTCPFASSNGFSRRCVTGASVALIDDLLSRSRRRRVYARAGDRLPVLAPSVATPNHGLSDTKAHGRRGRVAAPDGRRDDTQLVRARPEPGAGGPAAGEAERVSAGKEVADPHHRPPPAAAGTELDLEQVQGEELRPLRVSVHPTGDEREHGRLGVRRLEARPREPDARDERLAVDRHGDGPRNAEGRGPCRLEAGRATDATRRSREGDEACRDEDLGGTAGPARG